MPISAQAIEAKRDLLDYTLWNYTELLNKYANEMKALLDEAGGLESNLGLNSKYWHIRTKYQHVVNHFKE